jgi:predicted RNA-binding Zn-ribbon protein involved in translation (DUF1610 family)
MADSSIRENVSDYEVQDSELWALMYGLAGENPSQELVPAYRSDFGVVYKIGEIEVPADRVKALTQNEGVLDVVGIISFAMCPTCESLNLTVLMKCPNCGKQTLSKSEMVIHYECGHLAPLQEIIKPNENIYTCPKCGKPMKRMGIDYGRPGLAFTCPECKQASQYPLIKLLCERGHELKVDEPELRIYYVYRLGKALQTVPRIVKLLNSIKAKLTELGHNCVLLAKVTSPTGSVYITPLLVFGVPPLIADFILEETNWDVQVLGAIKKTAALNVRSLLVVKRGLEQPVKDMVNPERIKVVAFETEDEIADQVPVVISKMVTSPMKTDPSEQRMSLSKD